MNKAEFLTKVQNKTGFHSIIQDELAPDNIKDDPIEKRFLYVNHTNSDGTMGKTFVYYLYDTENDVASFYNVETPVLDSGENPDDKKFKALQEYLKTNFDAFFVTRVDIVNNWAEAEVFKLSAGKLVKTKVLVFKKGTAAINHLEIV